MNIFDVEKARSETKGCHEIIHFDNAGSSLMPTPVVQVLRDTLEREQTVGSYRTQNELSSHLEDFYTSAALLLGCQANEIAFMENNSRAWGLAFYGVPLKSGDKIITSLADYGSNIVGYLHRVRNHGIEILVAPNDSFGQIDIEAMKEMIDDKVRLISISYIPSSNGLINPASKVGKIAREAGIPYLLDACQAAGQIPLNVSEIGCDVLTVTGRKFLRGPRATGFMYIRKSFLHKLDPPVLDIHAARLIYAKDFEIRHDARRFESWEQYVAGKLALKTAIDYALGWGIASIRDRIFILANLLRQRLADLDKVNVTDVGLEKCGIVSFEVKDLCPLYVRDELWRNKVNVSISSEAASPFLYQSLGLTQTIRASVHYYNTEDEIERFVELLKNIL